MPDRHSHLTVEEARTLLERRCTNPFQWLGRREVEGEDGTLVVVRTIAVRAERVFAVQIGKAPLNLPMERVGDTPIFEAICRDPGALETYRFRLEDAEGHQWEVEDPYAFGPFMSEFDQHLFHEGTLEQAYEKLGAHPLLAGKTHGVLFTVWAPNAKGVSVVGDFNDFDGRCHPMLNLGFSGIWELFIPGLMPGSKYKFEIRQAGSDRLCQKSDPYAFASELRPRTASVIHGLPERDDKDERWQARRKEIDWFRSPVSIYEVHLPSWDRVFEEGGRMLTYSELAQKLVPYVKQLGFTHVELLPVMEHPLDDSWGYQCTGYYAPTRRHGSPEEFGALVRAFHEAGIGVILDWVPAHFPTDDHGLATFDGTCVYEHVDSRKSYHPDWKTLVFNYERNEVSDFLVSNALFWLERYGVDGLRADAVASMLYVDYSRKEGEWVPNQYGGRENLGAVEFLRRLNTVCHRRHPGVLTIAEESTAWPGVTMPVHHDGLGFSLKWNMGWMHDVLDFMSKDPVHRKYHMDQLTFQLLYAFSENFVLVLSHDEVVHGKRSLLDKMNGDVWQKFANLRLLYALLFGFPGKKHLFMGGEFGQWTEWNQAEALPWELLAWPSHRGIQRLLSDLNQLYAREPALHRGDTDPSGFQWLDFSDLDNTVVSFVRWAGAEARPVVCVYNLTPIPRKNYRIGVPFSGRYRELLNTDSEYYWGSNVGNMDFLSTEDASIHGFPFSLELTLPPLGALFLAPKD